MPFLCFFLAFLSIAAGVVSDGCSTLCVISMATHTRGIAACIMLSRRGRVFFESVRQFRTMRVDMVPVALQLVSVGLGTWIHFRVKDTSWNQRAFVLTRMQGN